MLIEAVNQKVFAVANKNSSETQKKPCNDQEKLYCVHYGNDMICRKAKQNHKYV